MIWSMIYFMSTVLDKCGIFPLWATDGFTEMKYSMINYVTAA